MRNEIILFEESDVKLEVSLKDETVWLNRNQIAQLFHRDVKTIGKHINNALKEELEEDSVVANFATTASDGKTYNISYYNLDVIISVGYRVKSQNGVKFRKWANKILKEYLIKGYSVNNKRLEYLEKTIKLIDIASRVDKDVKTDEGFAILKIISEYTKALDILDQYDHQELVKPKGSKKTKVQNINYYDCLDIISKMCFKETSSIFGIERERGLESIIYNIYQEIGDGDVYDSIEEKACNFLYFIVKNHVFIDGNKRIGATLFIYFLNHYGILKQNNENIILPETLVAVTLFIAQSNSKEKDIVIELIMNILLNK